MTYDPSVFAFLAFLGMIGILIWAGVARAYNRPIDPAILAERKRKRDKKADLNVEWGAILFIVMFLLIAIFEKHEKDDSGRRLRAAADAKTGHTPACTLTRCSPDCQKRVCTR